MQEHHLTGRDAMSILRLPPCSEIVCRAGAIWVTFAGDPADYVLRAGERVRVDRRRNAVISAIGAAFEPPRFVVSRRRACPEGASVPELASVPS